MGVGWVAVAVVEGVLRLRQRRGREQLPPQHQRQRWLPQTSRQACLAGRDGGRQRERRVGAAVGRHRHQPELGDCCKGCRRAGACGWTPEGPPGSSTAPPTQLQGLAGAAEPLTDGGAEERRHHRDVHLPTGQADNRSDCGALQAAQWARQEAAGAVGGLHCITACRNTPLLCRSAQRYASGSPNGRRRRGRRRGRRGRRRGRTGAGRRYERVWRLAGLALADAVSCKCSQQVQAATLAVSGLEGEQPLHRWKWKGSGLRAVKQPGDRHSSRAARWQALQPHAAAATAPLHAPCRQAAAGPGHERR